MKLVTEDFEPSEKLRKTQSKEKHDECIAWLEEQLELFKTDGWHIDSVALCVAYHNGKQAGGTVTGKNPPLLLFVLERVKALLLRSK